MAKAFISYSHRDEKALDRLHVHLATLRREGKIDAWYDRKILPGDDLDSTIGAHLKESDLFLALVSPDFLASNYCYETEMKNALRRHSDGTLRVIPIILEPCDWKSTPLGQLKAIPKDGKPISIWTNENVAYLDVITELRAIFSEQAQPTPEVRAETLDLSKKQGRRYRIKKDFDSFDRDDFKRKSFTSIQQFFQQSVAELNDVDESIKARFEAVNSSSFTCTVLNKAKGNREAHITVHAESSFAGAISYSFAKRSAPNSANGFIYVEASEYELFLKLSNFSFTKSQGETPMSAEQVSDLLWREFIAQAGIEHE